MELNQYEEKMKKSLANLEEEYGAIRAGRANPRILDRIQVDYYGTPTSLQGVANISVPEARMIQIQPFLLKISRKQFWLRIWDLHRQTMEK